MSFTWTEKLAVGHETIDAQHRELLERFNALLEACRRQEGKDTLGELFLFLDDYTRSHFREEEALMSRHGYPQLEEHRRLHREFVSRLEELKEAFTSRGPSLAVIVDTNQTLLEWIVGHIKSEDVQLGRFLETGPAS